MKLEASEESFEFDAFLQLESLSLVAVAEFVAVAAFVAEAGVGFGVALAGALQEV